MSNINNLIEIIVNLVESPERKITSQESALVDKIEKIRSEYMAALAIVKKYNSPKSEFTPLRRQLIDLRKREFAKQHHLKDKHSDMMGVKCLKCKKGTYRQKPFSTYSDDMDGTVQCSKCGDVQKRYPLDQFQQLFDVEDLPSPCD